FLIVGIVLGAPAIRSHAQALGSIEGTVVTPSGTPLSGAMVTAKGNSVQRTASTDGSGHFSIRGLPAGTYSVVAVANGYQAASSVVMVSAGGTASVRLALSVPRPLQPAKDEKAARAPVAASPAAPPALAAPPMGLRAAHHKSAAKPA